MDLKTFINRFLRPSGKDEWVALILIVTVSMGVTVFMYYAFTKWRFM